MSEIFYIKRAELAGLPIPDIFVGKTKKAISLMLQGKGVQTPKWQIDEAVRDIQNRVESDFDIFNKLRSGSLSLEQVLQEIHRKNIEPSKQTISALLETTDDCAKRMEIFNTFSGESKVNTRILFLLLEKMDSITEIIEFVKENGLQRIMYPSLVSILMGKAKSFSEGESLIYEYIDILSDERIILLGQHLCTTLLSQGISLTGEELEKYGLGLLSDLDPSITGVEEVLSSEDIPLKIRIMYYAAGMNRFFEDMVESSVIDDFNLIFEDNSLDSKYELFGAGIGERIFNSEGSATDIFSLIR